MVFSALTLKIAGESRGGSMGKVDVSVGGVTGAVVCSPLGLAIKYQYQKVKIMPQSAIIMPSTTALEKNLSTKVGFLGKEKGRRYVGFGGFVRAASSAMAFSSAFACCATLSASPVFISERNFSNVSVFVHILFSSSFLSFSIRYTSFFISSSVLR